MNKKEKQTYIKRYVERFKKYGYSPEALGWFKERQPLRFHILTSIDNVMNRSILDVGCGFADLYDYLKKKGWQGSYAGIDIVPCLIEVAKAKYPEIDLQVKDILKKKINRKFDYVFGSGIFNAKFSNMESYIKKILRKMFDLSKCGVAVDFMSNYVDFKNNIAYYASPEKIFKICKGLTKRVILRYDYMPYEFAIYMYKNDNINKDKNVFEAVNII